MPEYLKQRESWVHVTWSGNMLTGELIINKNMMGSPPPPPHHHHYHPHLVSLLSDTVSGPQVDLALNRGHETELSLEVDNRPRPEEIHEDYDRIGGSDA